MLLSVFLKEGAAIKALAIGVLINLSFFADQVLLDL